MLGDRRGHADLDVVRVRPDEEHVEVDLARHEGGPDEPSAAARVAVRGEGQAGARPVEPCDVALAAAVGEDPVEGEEHPVVGRIGPAGQPILELRGVAGHVVHDEVGCHFARPGQLADVVPRPEARVHDGVVHGVEARVVAVEGGEEGQHVHARERVEVGLDQFAEGSQVTPQAVGVREE